MAAPLTGALALTRELRRTRPQSARRLMSVLVDQTPGLARTQQLLVKSCHPSNVLPLFLLRATRAIEKVLLAPSPPLLPMIQTCAKPLMLAHAGKQATLAPLLSSLAWQGQNVNALHLCQP